MATTPKLAWPIRLVGGRLATVEQDSGAEIATCVYAALSTEQGSRPELPDYGIPDPSFLEEGVDPDLLLAEAEQMEPRAVLLASETFDDLTQRVRLEIL